MFIEIGLDDVDRRYFAALYCAGCLTTLPWGRKPFDCVVFVCDCHQAKSVHAELSAELVRANVDWVQVAGKGAEKAHDEIDLASVAAGRQKAVGDGVPMTSWHEEAVTMEQMADVAALCFGGHDRVLVLVVGRKKHLLASVAALRKRLG